MTTELHLKSGGSNSTINANSSASISSSKIYLFETNGTQISVSGSAIKLIQFSPMGSETISLKKEFGSWKQYNSGGSFWADIFSDISFSGTLTLQIDNSSSSGIQYLRDEAMSWQYRTGSSGSFSNIPSNSISISTTNLEINFNSDSIDGSKLFYAVNPTDPPSVIEIYRGMNATTSHFMGGANMIKFYQDDTFYTRIGNNSSFEISHTCFPPFTLVQTENGLKEIGNIKRNDLVLTNRGLVPVTKNMTTKTPYGYNFVKFPKDCFIKGYPERDLYMTKWHAFSLGIKKDTEDVWLWLEAMVFIGKLDIEEVHLDTQNYHNLIFDDQEEFCVEGMKVFSHHPNGYPYILPKEEYLGKINEEERKIDNVLWEEFVSEKPEEQDLGEYIADKIKF